MTDGSSLIKSKGLGGHSIIQSYVAGISYFPYILSFTGELLCKLVNFLPVQCILTSVYTLVAMSYERRRAVVQHHLPAVSSRSSLIACILIWVAALAASIPTFIEFTVFEVLEPSGDPGVTTVVGMVSTEEPQHYRQCGHHHHGRLSVLINGVFLLVIAYVIPLSLMLGYYGNIAIFIINKTKTVQPQQQSVVAVSQTHSDPSGPTPTASKTLSRRKSRIMKMLVLVTVLFCVCWLPYFTILITA
ncbi:hypothetical protein CAPTEDRAFT_207103, partial [Capitella teleta]